MKTRKSTWTKDSLKKLHKLREQGKEWPEIAKEMPSKSSNSCRLKYIRTDWDSFFGNPDAPYTVPVRKWSRDEMVQLDAYLQTDQSYDFIAEKLGRSYVSVERQAQTTDWKAWREILFDNNDDDNVMSGEEAEAKRLEFLEQISNSLLTLCRFDNDRVSSIKEKEFLIGVKLDKERLPCSFEEIRKMAEEELELMGNKNPVSMNLGEGRYIIVGDSHGKHTKKDMFKLLEKINKHLKLNKIIHIGHIIDDDKDISYDWGKFKNLIIVSKEEELRVIQDQRNKFDFEYEVVRESVNLGSLVVLNQDIIADYVRTPIKQLDTEIFDERLIVNCHRHEFFSRTSHNSNAYIASPGCLCEDHIIHTIKQIDFTDGRVVKQAYHAGFSKYRRMRHLCKYWERGMLVVEVDKDGNHTIIPCTIQKTKKGFATSYFDEIISSTGVFKPDDKIFVNGDIHSPDYDSNVLDIQEQICKDYKPTKQVNVGDTHSYGALNHHLMDRSIPILDTTILKEAATTHHILKRIHEWASEESYLIYGNHERFAQDFVSKYPQFDEYLDFSFLCALKGLDYKLIDLKQVLKIGSAKFIHGEFKMFGQAGTTLEKASRTFGKNVFIGHIHRPAIRFGCYSVGLSGQLDQNYNEAEASNWIHGFGLCNQFDGKSFMTTIAIVGKQCLINGKKYKPVDPKSWKLPKYDVKLMYEFEGK